MYHSFLYALVGILRAVSVVGYSGRGKSGSIPCTSEQCDGYDAGYVKAN